MKNPNPTAAIPGRARPYCLLLALMAITTVSCAMRGNRGVAAMGKNGTLAANLKMFGVAGKEGVLYSDHEVVLFQHEGPGCLTHMFQKGLRLLWRNGEEKEGKVYGSPGTPQPSQMTSYVWLYEW